MGKVWLHDLPFYLAKWAVEFDLYPGWELRSRRSGGFEVVLAIGTHHTAGNINASAAAEMNWQYNVAPSRPIGNGLLHRGTGRFTLGAAGATNTQGQGGPLRCSKGTIPYNQGNLYMFSIEAQNDGRGEPWSREMMNGYFRVCMAVAEMCKLDPRQDIFTHAAYVQPSMPGRKVDPSGPTRSHPEIGGNFGNYVWDDPAFNSEVVRLQLPAAPQPVPTVPTPTHNPNQRKKKRMIDGIVAPAQDWLGPHRTPHLVISGDRVSRATNSLYRIAAKNNAPVVTEDSEEHYMYLYNRMLANEVAANIPK